MENYRKLSHCTYDIKYHLVCITKYRKPVIVGKIAIRTCGYFVASSGNMTDEIIKEYIKNQDLQEKTKSDNFEIG